VTPRDAAADPAAPDAPGPAAPGRPENGPPEDGPPEDGPPDGVAPAADPDPADDEALAPAGALRARCEALAACLRARAAAGPVPDGERARLRADITALIRLAVARAREYAALEDEAKALAGALEAAPRRGRAGVAARPRPA
jgi:hypothetical protein